MFDIQPTPILKLNNDLFLSKKIDVWIKLDYLNHEFVSGNKLRKLKYNIEWFYQHKFNSITSFGGPFSNHLSALSFLGKSLNIPTIGYIRGDYHTIKSDTIKFCEDNEMEINYLPIQEYQNKENLDFINLLKNKHKNTLILPEGGKGDLAKKGCSEIIIEVENQLDIKPNYYISAFGTGTTICGIAEKLNENQIALGISAIKGINLDQNIKSAQNFTKKNLLIFDQYHFGGFAKSNNNLLEFVQFFVNQYSIPIDPIYNAKSLFALFDLAKNNFFPEHSKIVIIHTGGLQGITGFCQRYNLDTKLFGI